MIAYLKEGERGKEGDEKLLAAGKNVKSEAESTGRRVHGGERRWRLQQESDHKNDLMA